MSAVAWTWRRLRVMSAAEIAFRALRAARLATERAGVAAGWRPRFGETGGGVALFACGGAWREAWLDGHALETAALERMLAGEVELFGERYAIGSPASWHREPRTGIETPLRFGKAIDYRDAARVGDIKVIWELGRHQHLLPVAVAYAVSRETRYRDYLRAQIAGWIDANPFGRGVHWCSALEVALRLVSWAFVDSLLKLVDRDDGIDALCAPAIVAGESVFQHAWFVRHYLSRHSSANNHLIGELTGLYVGTAVFGLGARGRRWRDYAHAALEREARGQVHPDGVNKEQALHYHVWVLEYLLVAWLAARRAGQPFSAEYTKRLSDMAQFVHAISPPHGVPPQIGDSDDGFVTRFSAAWPTHPHAEVLASAAHIFGRAPADFRAAAGASQKAFWYGQLCAGGAAAARAPLRKGATKRRYPRIFEQGGYAVLGDGELHLVFDCGPLGHTAIAAHGHADALSVCLAIDGEWWLVDTGTYAYHGERAWREYFRGTSAHNTLEVDGESQSTSGGAFLWLKHADAKLLEHGVADARQWASGSHDGYEGLVHERTVRFDAAARAYSIGDSVQGAGARQLRLHFHFHPEVTLHPGGRRGTWLARRHGSTRTCRIECDARWTWEVVSGNTAPILGWYSDALHRRQPCRVLRGTLQAALPAAAETTLTLEAT